MQDHTTTRCDIAFRNASIIDGTGAPAVAGDVAISGDRIVAAGDLGGMAAAREVDCTGLVLALLPKRTVARPVDSIPRPIAVPRLHSGHRQTLSLSTARPQNQFQFQPPRRMPPMHSDIAHSHASHVQMLFCECNICLYVALCLQGAFQKCIWMHRSIQSIFNPMGYRGPQ